MCSEINNSKLANKILNDIELMDFRFNKTRDEKYPSEKNIELNMTSESIKIKMLTDAGYYPSPMQENYLMLVDFVKTVSNENLGYHFLAREARKLLNLINEE